MSPTADARPGVQETPAGTNLPGRLAAVWASVLELPEVAPDGNFFDLGGNSMLAVELVFQIASELDQRIPVKLLVESQTPLAMAQAITERAASRTSGG